MECPAVGSASSMGLCLLALRLAQALAPAGHGTRGHHQTLRLAEALGAREQTDRVGGGVVDTGELALREGSPAGLQRALRHHCSEEERQREECMPSAEESSGRFRKKGPWTKEEDAELIRFVEAHGARQWRKVGRETRLRRDPQSCRLRWAGTLSPAVSRLPFSPAEDAALLQAVSWSGETKWATIAANQFPTRSGYQIQCRWHTLMNQKRLQQQEEASQAALDTSQSLRQDVLGKEPLQQSHRVSVSPSGSSGRLSPSGRVPQCWSGLRKQQQQQLHGDRLPPRTPDSQAQSSSALPGTLGSVELLPPALERTPSAGSLSTPYPFCLSLSSPAAHSAHGAPSLLTQSASVVAINSAAAPTLLLPLPGAPSAHRASLQQTTMHPSSPPSSQSAPHSLPGPNSLMRIGSHTAHPFSHTATHSPSFPTPQSHSSEHLQLSSQSSTGSPSATKRLPSQEGPITQQPLPQATQQLLLGLLSNEAKAQLPVTELAPQVFSMQPEYSQATPSPVQSSPLIWELLSLIPRAPNAGAPQSKGQQERRPEEFGSSPWAAVKLCGLQEEHAGQNEQKRKKRPREDTQLSLVLELAPPVCRR